jgi:MATE family multidrug resistance protein
MSFLSELKPMSRLAGPVIVAELGWMSMGIVDAVMVGPLGPAAIGAVGVGTALHMGFVIFGMGLLLGLDTFVSQAFGRRDVDDCHRWFVQGVWLAVLAAIPLSIVCGAVWLGIPKLGFHPEILAPLSSYVAVVIWSTAPLLLYACFRRYLQGMHVVKPLMIALVTANVVNAVCNWVLIYGHWGMPALGVAGAAWATTASRVYMMFFMLAAVVMHDHATGGSLRELSWRFDTERIRRLTLLGLPAATQITLEVGAFAAASILAGFVDPVSSASHQIAINIAAFAFMVPLGMSAAGAVRVGAHVGAGRRHDAQVAGWTALLLGVLVMAGTGMLFLTMPRALIGVFTTDEAVILLSTSLLFVAAVFQLFDGLQAVATGVLRGLGETRMPMITNLVGHWFVGLPLGYVLCFVVGMGVVGLWWGLLTGLIVCGVVLLWGWHIRIAGYIRAEP